MPVYSPTWIYLGHDSTQVNPNGMTTGTTLSQAQSVVGRTFPGSDMQGSQVTGTATNSGGLNFGRGIDELTYSLSDGNGASATYKSFYTSHVVVHTAISVARDDPDNPGEILRSTINLRGVVIQMQNGDFFMRPYYLDTNSWNATLRDWGVTGIQITGIDQTLTGNSFTDAATGGLSGSATFNPNFFNETTFVPCFVAGTLIATEFGLRPVETLVEGDCVWTRDNGLQPIRWIGKRSLEAEVLQRFDKLVPIRIRAHALGPRKPSIDLLISPQHRVLLRSGIALRMFGAEEVLVAAKQLLAVDGVEVATDLAEVTYVHILFDQHEIVLSNDAETESLFTGPEALRSVGPAARDEILTLFPELGQADYQPQSARPFLNGRDARDLVRRHIDDYSAAMDNQAHPN